MEKMPSSIFNDVIGPVMRGPSISHVAAAARIGRLIRMSAENQVQQVIVDFDPNGSLAESYHGHGSDIGLVSGLLGMELTDPRVGISLDVAKQENVDVQFNIIDYGAVHPNNYRMKVTSGTGKTHLWEAISVGGGMIEMQKLDGFDINVCGDFYELLVFSTGEGADAVKAAAGKLPRVEYILDSVKDNGTLVNIKTVQPVSGEILEEIKSIPGVSCVIILDPILPTKSSANCKVPFRTAAQLLEFAKTSDRQMWQMATLYESMRGGTTEEEAYQKMYDLASIMLNCVEEGLAGTEYKDRILGPQAFLMDKARLKNPLMPADLLCNVIRNITAVMEVKSSFGVIIAAPTAGSCGCLPGTVTGVGETLKLDQDTMTKGLLAAGLIGVFVSEQATFAAEVAGCQAECGVGSSMAAAAIVQMLGGTVEQCCDAASLAMQNITGLVCDPVANRVEVPCLGKNVMGGSNAIASASMILAGYDKVIPLDETILAMYDIGQKLPIELRCTLGGLGKLPLPLRSANVLPDGVLSRSQDRRGIMK